MFTGIVKDRGRIAALRHNGGGLRLRVAWSSPDHFDGLTNDESVSINGVCQTVVATGGGWFDVDTIGETLSKTTLGALRTGDHVNLERALRPIDRLGGHLVLGHVDAPGTVATITDTGTSRDIRIAFPDRFAPYIVETGSITIDGVSLTVARLDHHHFTVAIIPFTVAHTTIATLRQGSAVNLEFDILGKYIARQLTLGTTPPTHATVIPDPGDTQATRLTETWLRSHGF